MYVHICDLSICAYKCLPHTLTDEITLTHFIKRFSEDLCV